MTNPVTTLEDIIRFRNQILDSSEKTSELTGVMEEMAFQTSLLALHAALAAEGEKTRQETPGSPAPPATTGLPPSPQEWDRKDS